MPAVIGREGLPTGGASRNGGIADSISYIAKGKHSLTLVRPAVILRDNVRWMVRHAITALLLTPRRLSSRS